MFSSSVINNDALRKIFFVSERLIIFDGLGDVFGHIVQTAVALIHAEAATIRVFDFPSGKLKIVKGYGVSAGFMSQPDISIGEGIAGHVVLDGKPFISEDLVNEPRSINKEFAKLEGIRSVMSIPLKTRESCIGALNVYRKKGDPFSDHDILILNIFGLQAAEAIEKADLIRELTRQASFDHLTGVYNKQTLLREIDSCLGLSHRHSIETSIIFLDLDNFKLFNDTHGHILGDKLLCDFGKLLRKNCRKSDIIGRFGGEEFIIIAPHTSKEKALALANKLKSSVSRHRFIGKKNEKAHVTFSAGISTFPSDSAEAADLISKADEAMYNSKKTGKNCITAWPCKLLIEGCS
ncbi:MAG: GGDEF domain-containing protein [Nitrospirae bacterium]|nr:GGDEF domain-containing protein [Nitrospirota bacterium]